MGNQNRSSRLKVCVLETAHSGVRWSRYVQPKFNPAQLMVNGLHSTSDIIDFPLHMAGRRWAAGCKLVHSTCRAARPPGLQSCDATANVYMWSIESSRSQCALGGRFQDRGKRIIDVHEVYRRRRRHGTAAGSVVPGQAFNGLPCLVALQ